MITDLDRNTLPARRDPAARVPEWLNLPEPRSFRPKRRYRAVWISDVHLGTRGCQADMLVDFLRAIETEHLYLVGDIIDGWSLRKAWFWPDAHNEVVRRILKMAHRGTQVTLIIGNHDEVLRDFAGFSFGGVELATEAVHRTADGRRLLVTHGDAFDGVVLYARWLAFLGDKAYALLLRANIVVNAVRKRMGMPYWSLSAYMKKKVKNAVQFVCNFEQALANEGRTRGFDGIVCGHIHCAEIRQIGDITYFNDGDWVESCTALVEDFAGAISIVEWKDDPSAYVAFAEAVEQVA
ncbi:UDP-2,3-diacylglucosamine diphosphatase [Novosphingobium sp.]|uniref:UDP-2,3-diacylglucosamine diphosphatase n=1 Tax=Novosphingobium sp. TaxID=1874826 RepID=UPI00261B4EF8|nr:UDP-2,3-diacylglucosamine diphosphatase [Novosphingobium sp.]